MNIYSEAIVVTATFTPIDGNRDELVQALRETVPAIHSEPGCLLYAVHLANDGTVVQVEKWASRELLDEHSAGQPVAALKAAIGPLLARPQVIAVMTAARSATARRALGSCRGLGAQRNSLRNSHRVGNQGKGRIHTAICWMKRAIANEDVRGTPNQAAMSRRRFGASFAAIKS